MKTQILAILKGQRPLIDIWHYIIGNYRYWLYYNSIVSILCEADIHLIRVHIRQQIDWRISMMNKECYNEGSCIKCGCSTTQLQMCNKACDGKCYPKMLSRKHWNIFKTGKDVIIDKSSLFEDKLRLNIKNYPKNVSN